MIAESDTARSVAAHRLSPTAPKEWFDELCRLADLINPDPAADLDNLLDAAARAFARFGFSRTSVNDIAREANLSRSSVYRIAGTPETILRMLIARDLRHAIASSLQQQLWSDPPTMIVQITATFIETVHAHPVLRKIRDDEPELIAGRLITTLPVMVALVSSRVATLLEPAITSGALAFDDSESAAQLIVRMAMSCLIAPPSGDVRTFLDTTLLPALTPP